MKIIFATGNKGKLREAAEVLGPDYEIVSPASLGITEDIPETGSTLQENSLQKAQYLFERTGLPCFADDTGLEVDALGGAPGRGTITMPIWRSSWQSLPSLRTGGRSPRTPCVARLRPAWSAGGRGSRPWSR